MSEEQKIVAVIDSSATPDSGTRTHYVSIKGVITGVDFSYGEPTIMPFDVGVKFLQQGFTVLNDIDGEVIKMPAFTNDVIRFHIQEDEVVAKYDELSMTALKLRAVSKTDGERFADANEESRKEIIDFLKNSYQEMAEDVELDLESEDGVLADIEANIEKPIFYGIEPKYDIESELEVDVGGEVISEPDVALITTDEVDADAQTEA